MTLREYRFRVALALLVCVGFGLVLASLTGGMPGTEDLRQRQPPTTKTDLSKSDTPTSLGTVVSEVTSLAELPSVTSLVATTETLVVTWDGLQGLNVSSAEGDPNGKTALKLIGVPINSVHRVGIRAVGLLAAATYRVSVWVKIPVSMHVALDLRDGANVHAGAVTFDPAAASAAHFTGNVAKAGVDNGSDDWKMLWAELTPSDGEIFLYVALAHPKGVIRFVGDGRKSLLLGEIAFARAR